MKGFRIVLVAILVLGTVGLFAGAAFAQGSAEQPPDEVLGGGFPNNQEGPSDIGPGVGPSNLGAQGGVLPFTGAQLVGFTAVGAVAVAAGTVLLRRTRHDRARA